MAREIIIHEGVFRLAEHTGGRNAVTGVPRMMRRLAVVVMGLVLGICVAAKAQAANQFQVETRYVHTMGNQTLLEIVRRLYPDRQRYWKEITKAFVRVNPHAFNATSQLLPGVRMQVPQHLPRVGLVSALSGNAWAVDFNGVKRTLSNNQEIYLGDRLITGADSRASIVAVDEAEFFLRPRTELTFRTYRYRSEEPDTSIVQLLKGGLRTITGRIGNGRPQGYRLLTRIATIGVRGTDFGVRLCGRDECPVAPGLSVAAAPGLYVSVLDGEIAMRTQTATQVVRRGDFYYTPSAKRVPQRLYEKPKLIFSDEELAVLQDPKPTLLTPSRSSRKASMSVELILLLPAAAMGAARRRRRRARATAQISNICKTSSS